LRSFVSCFGAPPDLHSFPTRRSSDLPAGDVRVSVGRLVNAYGSAGAAATLRGLQRLDQSQPVVQLHEGLVQLWAGDCTAAERTLDRKSTRLNSSHSQISYAVFCLKKK